MVNSNVPHLRSRVSVSCIEIVFEVKILNSVFSSIKQTHDGSVVSVMRTERLQTRSLEQSVQLVQLQSALNGDYHNFSGKTKHVPHFRAHNWKTFPKRCACTLTAEQFQWFIQLRKEMLQHFARFWRFSQSVMWSRSMVSLFSFLFLDFTAINDCVFNNKNNYSTLACWISNNYNRFGATIISSAPSLYGNLRVPTRVYDVEGGAGFSKNSTFVFFDGAAWTSRLRSPSPIMAPGLDQFTTPLFGVNHCVVATGQSTSVWKWGEQLIFFFFLLIPVRSVLLTARCKMISGLITVWNDSCYCALAKPTMLRRQRDMADVYKLLHFSQIFVSGITLFTTQL